MHGSTVTSLNREFRVSKSVPVHLLTPYPHDDFSTFILIFLSVQLVDFYQFYTFRYFFAKDEISAEAEYIRVIDSGFSLPGSAQI